MSVLYHSRNSDHFNTVFSFELAIWLPREPVIVSRVASVCPDEVPLARCVSVADPDAKVGSSSRSVPTNELAVVSIGHRNKMCRPPGSGISLAIALGVIECHCCLDNQETVVSVGQPGGLTYGSLGNTFAAYEMQSNIQERC